VVFFVMATFSDSIDISAAPEVVFETVSHLENMGKFSPENTGGSWKDGSGPKLGAKFRGTNSNGKTNWTTMCKVVEFQAPTSFAFSVTVGPVKVARWSYTIEKTPEGSRVSETWLDQRSKLAKRFSGSIRDDREAFTRESIRTTLEGLKAHLDA
jgi:hypothetical protein